MRAVIPAAGEGTRLRPLTGERPKALVDVGGKPILAHCFGQLQAAGVDEFVVIVGYEGEAIVDRFGGSFDGTPITYVFQRERNGLAHALLEAEAAVDGACIVLNGDNVLRADLGRALARYRDDDVDAVALVERVSEEAARRTGVLETRGDRVVGVVEKSADPPSTLASAGCYVFSPVVFDACRDVEPGAEGEYQLSDAVDRLCSWGRRVVAVRLDGWRVNVNTPADVERAERLLRGAE